MHCEGLSQCSIICMIFLLNSREQILSQHQQESVNLENVMFSMEKHYADIDNEARRDYESNGNQIKKQVRILLCLYLFIWQMLLSKMAHK